MRKVWFAAFIVVLVGVSLWLMLNYDVLAIARAFIGPAWRSAEVAARMVAGPVWNALTVFVRPFAQNYLIRRVESPLWTVLMKGALVLVGARFMGLVYDQLRASSALPRRVVTWWEAQHRALRWGIVSAIIFGAGFLGFGLFILPLWLPLSAKALHSLRFTGLDRFLNHWVAPRQRQWRRLMRTNGFWRVVRRPYRIAMYLMLVGIRRLARALRRWIAGAWHRHPRSVPASNLVDASPRQ